MGRIWPRARTEQAIPVGSPTRTGVAVAVRPGHDVRLISTSTLAEESGKRVGQWVKCEIGQKMNIMGVYISHPQSKKEQTEDLLRKARETEKNSRTILVGDMKDRQNAGTPRPTQGVDGNKLCEGDQRQDISILPTILKGKATARKQQPRPSARLGTGGDDTAKERRLEQVIGPYSPIV